MFPVAAPQLALPAARSLRILFAFVAEEERRLFGDAAGRASLPSPPSQPSSEPASDPTASDRDELRARTALTAWSGDFLAPSSRIGEVPDPGVLLCLLYDGPAADAALPIDVFAQTLRRYALRDPALRARFEEHVERAGTFVPPWLAPELRRARSQESFDRAMKMAREQGFAAAAPLFEGVRGDCFAPAQIAVALHELRELRDPEGALARLDQVVRVSPRNVAAHMQRAQILLQDPGRRVEAAGDYLAVLRELARIGDATTDGPSSAFHGSAPGLAVEVQAAATEALWALCREYGDPRQLEAAAALAKADPARGFEAVSRYVHTHPCAWDGQMLLASLSLSRQSFDLTIKLLASVRWLFPDDPNPHFVYGQALAARGNTEAAAQALEQAARIAPADPDITRWLTFTRAELAPAGHAPGDPAGHAAAGASAGVDIAHHLTRTLLLLVGFVRRGGTHPAALRLRRVPGDVSLTIVAQALAAQERRRFGDGASPSGEIDLGPIADRTLLLDHEGNPLHVDQLVGDVPDPGVLLALLHEAPVERGQLRPADQRAALLALVAADAELAGKLDKHLASPDATLMARLDLR